MSKEHSYSARHAFSMAFKEVNLKYISYFGNVLDTTPDIPLVQEMTVEYFTAGLDFFMNRQRDPFLRILGAAGYEAFNLKLARAFIVADIKKYVSDQLRLGEEAVAEVNGNEFQPITLILSGTKDGNIVEDFHVVFQSDFYKKAQESPLFSLADIASACSMIRDFVCLRRMVDTPERMRLRATVAAAQVLYVAQEHALSPESVYGRMQMHFPLGFQTKSSIPLWHGTPFFLGGEKAIQN